MKWSMLDGDQERRQAQPTHRNGFDMFRGKYTLNKKLL